MNIRHARIMIVVLGLSPALVFAQPTLGRLFFTPAERTALDRAPADAHASTEPTSRTLNGIVRRSDGQGTVWIDGKPQVRRLAGTGRVAVKTASGDELGLKVGESTGMNADDAPMIRIEPGR
jgi:hypothetical protein